MSLQSVWVPYELLSMQLKYNASHDSIVEEQMGDRVTPAAKVDLLLNPVSSHHP